MVNVIDLGLIKYTDALSRQYDILKRRIDGGIQDTLILCEHYPVVTLGRTSQEESSVDTSFFDSEKIDVIKTARGGKITYHAPGQLLIYPVIDLSNKKKDVAFYIDVIERAITDGLNRLGVKAGRTSRRGVWAGNLKIAFIGVALKRWVTYHGACVNINNDIYPFDHFNPCGESDIKVTSVKEILGHEVDISEVKSIFSKAFSNVISEEYKIEALAR